MLTCYLSPSPQRLRINVILVLQVKKPHLREDNYQVQYYPAMKRKNADLNCGRPKSAAHVLSNILVLSNLLHVMALGRAYWYGTLGYTKEAPPTLAIPGYSKG